MEIGADYTISNFECIFRINGVTFPRQRCVIRLLLLVNRFHRYNRRCLCGIKGLIVPVIVNLERFSQYSYEAKRILASYEQIDLIPADEYDS